MTPTELVAHAAERGLKAIALSDHDTIAGIDEAIEAGKKYGVEIVYAGQCKESAAIAGKTTEFIINQRATPRGARI